MLGGMATEPDFLDFLAAVVDQDRGPAGFEGVLCFGLEQDAGVRWLEVSIGRRNRSVLVERPSREVQAAMLLPSLAARSIMTPGADIDVDGTRSFGDASMLARFIDRYLRQLDMLSLRAGKWEK